MKSVDATEVNWNESTSELLAAMTLEERMACLSTVWPGVPRLGIPPFNWGGECLHGLCHAGPATVFPTPIALAATFDAALVRRVASAIGREARARYFDDRLPRTPFVSLCFWTPNINLLRDPRWGRGQETWGEDPFLTGLLGAAFVRGLQGDDPARLQVAACAKHFAVHSGPEAIRTSFNAVIPPKLLAETYLPHFKALVEAGVATVMGAYNAVNGQPCCANPALLEDTLRQAWGFQGFTVSDAGAIAAFHRAAPQPPPPDAGADAQWGFLARQMAGLDGHGVSGDAAESAALAVKSGCDMSLGGDLAPEHLREAMRRGLLTEAELDRALGRVLQVAARLGILDPSGGRRANEPGREVIQSRAHLALSRRAAARSVVLLKNNGVLPLDSRAVRTLAISGPTAADVNVLLGNFYRGISARLVTIVEGIVAGAPDGITATFLQGCGLYRPNLHDSTWSIGLAEQADVAIAVVGLSPLMEGEHGECIGSALGGDRDSLELPAVQVEYLRRLKKQSGKPLVVVVTGGSPIVLGEVAELADALLLCWYPGEQGGLGVADVLFGRVNPCGRLPFTLPAAAEDVPPFADYSMRGRGYRYGARPPLFPFGYGLGYSAMRYGPVRIGKGGRRASVTIANEGSRPGDEVAQLYIRVHADVDGPRWNLRGIRRIRLLPGATRTVSFAITKELLNWVGEDGEPRLAAGDVTIAIGPHAPDAELPANLHL